MKKVIIYTGPMCNFCSAAKHLLNKKKVSYTEFDIAADMNSDDIVNVLDVIQLIDLICLFL